MSYRTKLALSVLLMLWLFAVAAPCFAGETTLDWTNPTQGETCTPAGAITIDGIRIYELVVDIPNDTTETFVIQDKLPGLYTYVATAYNADGESQFTSSVEKTVTDFVTTDIVVKTISKIPGGFLLLGVGTVPLGTACDVNQEVNGHYAVPFDNIIWSDPARNDGTAPLPLIVVAQCG